MTEKLRPCPFCGGEAEVTHEIDGFCTVECVKCGALVDGIDAWNTRAERTCRDLGGCDEAGMQVFNCSECGCVLLEASRVCISVAYAACMDINGRIAQMDSEDADDTSSQLVS